MQKSKVFEDKNKKTILCVRLSLIPTLCFEEQKSFKKSKIEELPKNQIMAPTDEKAMPLQFNEKKRTISL